MSARRWTSPSASRWRMRFVNPGKNWKSGFKKEPQIWLNQKNNSGSWPPRSSTAQENERKRIALEIHDVLGSSLSAIKFKAEEALSCLPGEGTVDEPIQPLKALIPLIRDTIDEARRIQNDLRPPLLDDLGIIPTFTWFCRRFKTIYASIEIEQAFNISEEEIPDHLKIGIFRIAQEALHNIGKHANADSVYLGLKKADGVIELCIKDNGDGFDPGSLPSREISKNGLGLSSMRERVEYSGGSFSIDTAKGKGTIIRAVWQAMEPMKTEESKLIFSEPQNEAILKTSRQIFNHG